MRTLSCAPPLHDIIPLSITEESAPVGMVFCSKRLRAPFNVIAIQKSDVFSAKQLSDSCCYFRSSGSSAWCTGAYLTNFGGAV
jgi:hypothetical protein